MCFQFWVIGKFIPVETRCADDIFQHVANASVHVCNIEATVIHGIDNIFNLLLVARFHEVILCVYLRFGVSGPDPVCHHDTVIAPLIAKDCGQKFMIFLRIGTVDLVV